MKKTSIDFETIIIGGGGAGLTAAIHLAKENHKVAIISKVPPIFSHTSAAQGGINANFGNKEPDDWKWHMYDTVKGSDWLGDQDAIEIMCKNANDAVLFLQKIGVNFDLDSDGTIRQKKYGGQTLHYGSDQLAHRACSVTDRTGKVIMHSLLEEALKHNVKFINYNFVIDLMIEDQICYGLTSYDIPSGIIQTFKTTNVIIATGGYSQIYKETTSSNTCTGDGIALIANKSIGLKDMEFVQFHPTSLYNTGILISETTRSLGGILLNKNSEPFMKNYAPKYKELASRDIVSRAMTSELLKLNGYGEHSDHLMLDLRHIDSDALENQLTNVHHVCKTFLHINPKNDLIPVTPASHYTMGGIPTNKKCEVVKITHTHQTKIIGLYAIGEAACVSVHGANRLGCNSLLDIIVFGIEVSKHILSKNYEGYSNIFKYNFKNPLEETNGNLSALSLIDGIKIISQKYLGMNRSAEDLKKGYSQLKKIGNLINQVSINLETKKWNNKVISFLELKNLHTCAMHTAFAAISRKESRGSHYRKDFSERNDKLYWKHTITTINENNEEVIFSKIRGDTKDVGFFQLESRNY